MCFIIKVKRLNCVAVMYPNFHIVVLVDDGWRDVRIA